jgi:5-methylcytosine-specific restriction endonuclease McrA
MPDWKHGGRSRHQRGYGWGWEKLRTHILARDKHLCQPCRSGSPSRVTPATEVDHIVPKAKGGTDSECNLQAICEPCHRAKSIADQGKKPRCRKLTFGPDGWPIEGS